MSSFLPSESRSPINRRPDPSIDFEHEERYLSRDTSKGGQDCRMSKARIMIADESTELYDRFKTPLTQGGYEVVLARSLHEVFQAAQKARPDVVIATDGIEKMTGLQMCEELRAEIDTCYAAILLMVPAVERSLQDRARETGVNAVLPRNADGAALMKQIEALLSPA